MIKSDVRIDPGEWNQHIEDVDGHQLIVAGPGTGKTEFLVRRATHLITSGKTTRDRLVVLTFSRRAARDLRKRIDEKVGGGGHPIEVSTFHSLALRLIETAASERPIPLTAPEQVGLVHELLQLEDPSDWPVAYRGILTSRPFATEIADFLLRCSERLLSPGDLADLASHRSDWRGIPGLFERYRGTLETSGRIDYGTLLVLAVDLLKTEVGSALAQRYEYVLVDEFQDTSTAQAEMARLLSIKGNLTVTGDPYQSVYSFRGAELRNVAKFSERFPKATRLVLAKSFRVPDEILESALRVVSSGELPGAAGPVEAAEHPGRVEAYVFDQETAEAEWIAAEIERVMRTESVPAEHIAVLIRSKRELLKELSRALTRRGIPHDPPDSRLIDHPSVRMVADLVTVATLEDSSAEATSAVADAAMRRILLGPLVGATLGLERELLRRRRRDRSPWSTVLAGETSNLDDLVFLLQSPGWATDSPASEGFWELWTNLNGFGGIATDDSRVGWRRALSSLAQVLSRQTERDPDVSLARFFELTEDEAFESTPLLSHRSEGGRVSLTTLHQSKGLEFDVVFIANAVEGVFPDLRRSRRMLRPELLDVERTTDPPAQHLFQVQEEMRLAYTAMTRASKRVIWTATKAGIDQGERRPSRFLVAASGVRSLAELGPPVERELEPVTIAEIETLLRRTLLDPAASGVDRLAAAALLAEEPGEHWSVERFAGVASRGPDSPIISLPLRLSPSQGDSYLTCPRRYALERRLNLSSPDSPYLLLGSHLHLALEKAEREIIGTDQTHADKERAIEILEDIWQQADFGTPQLTAAWLDIARETLIRLYDDWPSDGKPIDLEIMVRAKVGDIDWSGRIDRLERGPDGLKVVDYKSSGTAMSVQDAAGSIQLGFYVTAVADSREESVTGAEFWYPRAKSKTITTRQFSMAKRDEVMDAMVEVGKRVLDEDWTPRLNDRCHTCAFRHSCPAWVGDQGAYTP